MDLPIELDHQTKLIATEIRDERPYRVLSAKFPPLEPPVPQQMPEDLFGRSQALSKVPSQQAHPYGASSFFSAFFFAGGSRGRGFRGSGSGRMAAS
jgi:hypothetical protein